MRSLFTFCAAVVALTCCAASFAHEIAPSYLTVVSRSDSEAGPRLRWELPLAELRWTVDLDANGDGTIGREEVTARRAAIGALAVESLEVSQAGARCTLSPSGLTASRHAEAEYAALELHAACPKEGPLRIDNRMFFGDHPAHQLLLDVTTEGGRFTGVLSPIATGWSEPRSASWLATLGDFLRHGVWHIWIGYDHIAFLTLLLLPSVLRNDSGRWQVAVEPRAVMRDLLLIVTAFTLAHSVTLGLAATGTVSLPARPIEIAIAASIVIAGLLNLVPRISRLRLPLAFAFGLVHGFGFANALAELGAGGVPLVPMLAGFNLGVEVGQLAIVAVVLPLLLWLRRQPLYPRRLMPAASLVTAIAGAIWVIQRW
jgi:hypothetical protein